MEIKAKLFEELDTTELFEILKARAQVFVAEQKCAYQDPDDRDYQSLHVFMRRGRSVIAYLRAFPKDGDTGTVQIGRVLTIERGAGLGAEILAEGIRKAQEVFGARRFYIEAQCYATGFYEKKGFRICSEPFPEDGIPHVRMTMELDL